RPAAAVVRDVVEEDDLVDRADEVEVALPGDVVGLDDGHPLRHLPARAYRIRERRVAIHSATLRGGSLAAPRSFARCLSSAQSAGRRTAGSTICCLTIGSDQTWLTARRGAAPVFVPARW